MLSYFFQDWKVNFKNPKARLILLMFRCASACSKLSKPYVFIAYPYLFLYRFIVEWIFGIELPWRLKIGPNLRLFHGQSLVINDCAIIGQGVVIRHCTTIGVSKTDKNMGGGAPVIGDFVDIGSNVVILGNITVGDNSVIGAGSVVVKDVPKNTVVVGNPARIVRFI